MQFNTPQISCAKLSSILLKAILPTRSAVATLLRSIFPTSSLTDLQITLSRLCTSTLWKSSWETRDGDTSSLSPSPDWYALSYTDKTDALGANGQFVGRGAGGKSAIKVHVKTAHFRAVFPAHTLEYLFDHKKLFSFTEPHSHHFFFSIPSTWMPMWESTKFQRRG